MKTKIDAQSETPATPISLISQLALTPANVAAKIDLIPEEQIQELAYKLYEERGRVNGSEMQDRLEAESILREQGRLAA